PIFKAQLLHDGRRFMHHDETFPTPPLSAPLHRVVPGLENLEQVTRWGLAGWNRPGIRKGAPCMYIRGTACFRGCRVTKTRLVKITMYPPDSWCRVLPELGTR
ncbi:unnamed protein product, partial [Ectocarpus sp. 12 AP-2014]